MSFTAWKYEFTFETIDSGKMDVVCTTFTPNLLFTRLINSKESYKIDSRTGRWWRTLRPDIPRCRCMSSPVMRRSKCQRKLKMYQAVVPSKRYDHYSHIFYEVTCNGIIIPRLCKWFTLESDFYLVIISVF